MVQKQEIIAFIESVIQKKFDVKSKGYDPNSVDETIDEIFSRFKVYIESFIQMSNEIETLKEDNKQLKTKNESLKNEVSLLNEKIQQMESSGFAFNTINNRLDNLEKAKESNETKTKSTKKVD